eukprot:COSAG01_NODE_31_length_35900_cov_44.332169_5_plen_37_part_00
MRYALACARAAARINNITMYDSLRVPKVPAGEVGTN